MQEQQTATLEELQAELTQTVELVDLAQSMCYGLQSKLEQLPFLFKQRQVWVAALYSAQRLMEGLLALQLSLATSALEITLETRKGSENSPNFSQTSFLSRVPVDGKLDE